MLTCFDAELKKKNPGQGEVEESLWLTFNPKGGSLGRLPEAGEGVELQVGGQGLDQANGHSAFTLAERSGSYTAFTKEQNFPHGIFGGTGLICRRGRSLHSIHLSNVGEFGGRGCP